MLRSYKKLNIAKIRLPVSTSPKDSYEEKFRLVGEWWNHFRFHLAMAVKSPAELNRFLGNSLSAETMYLLSEGAQERNAFLCHPLLLITIKLQR